MTAVTKKGSKAAKQSRESWIAAALQMLAAKGVAHVRVEPLARSMGVTKGSFYWHFADRPALLRGLLETWEQVQTAAIIGAVQSAGGTAMERVTMLRDLTLEPGLMEIDMAIRAWASHDELAADAVARVDLRRIDFCRGLFLELGFSPLATEARAFIGYSLLLGNYYLDVPHGSHSRQDVLDACLSLLTRAPDN